MKEYRGDIWKWRTTQHPVSRTAIVIPTNGTVKRDGSCVMGAGLAKQLVEKYPTFAQQLGESIKQHGNRVIWFQQERVITFPVKHNWFEKANLLLICKSCRQLNRIIKLRRLVNVGIPHVGCGNGRLNWDDVKPILESLLDTKCTIITEA